jgi:hypothetical protein
MCRGVYLSWPWLEESGQPHARPFTSIPIGREAGWGPQPVWITEQTKQNKINCRFQSARELYWLIYRHCWRSRQEKPCPYQNSKLQPLSYPNHSQLLYWLLTCMHARTHARTHAHTQTHTHTQKHTHTHKNTHTHIHLARTCRIHLNYSVAHQVFVMSIIMMTPLVPL